MHIPTPSNIEMALAKSQTHHTINVAPIFSCNDIPLHDSTPHGGIAYRLIESPITSTPPSDTGPQSNTFTGECFAYSLNLCTSRIYNNAIGVVRTPMTSLGTYGKVKVGHTIILNGDTQEQWKVMDMRYISSANNHCTYRITSTQDGRTLRLHIPYAWSYEISNNKEASKALENYQGQGEIMYFFD